MLLGAGAPQSGAFNAGLFSEIDRYVQVDLISPVAETLLPRVTVASVPWALVAQQANEIVRDPDAPLTTRYLSIPASAFTSEDSSIGWSGNNTGTNRNFGNAGRLFAPVQLPHGATVTQLQCGGFDASTLIRLEFTLFRNQPQQANVDIAVAGTSFADTGFRFVTTSAITSPVISNIIYNYYMIARAIPLDVGACPSCTVGYCRISYTSDAPFP